MNGYFEISAKNAENVLLNSERTAKAAPERLAGSTGEKAAADLIFTEIKPYCDEAEKESFLTYPTAASFCQRCACVFITLSAILFKASEISGTPVFSCGALLFCLAAFCLFTYKFLFGGRALDRLFKPRHSQNLFLTRHARSTTLSRLVLTAKADEKARLNTPFFGAKAPTVFLTLCIIGNTLTFCLSAAHLFSGTVQNSAFFGAASDFCLFMCIIYIFAFFLYDTKHASGESVSGLAPAYCTVEIMKALSDNSVRFPNTEVCVLIVGADFPCHDGAVEFINRKKRAFRDVPTVFVSLEELTVTSKTAVYFNREKSKNELAEIITDSAESYGISIKRESALTGTPLFSPFDNAGFEACSFGTSKECSGKYSATTKTAITDTLNILKDTVRFYGNERQ